MSTFFLKKIKIFFIACDYLVISFICYYLSNKYFHFNLIPFRNEHYKYTIFMIVGLWFLISKYTKIYENFFTEDSTIHFRNLSKANLLFIISIGVFYKNLMIDTRNYFHFIIIFSIFTFLYFFIIRLILFGIRKKIRGKFSNSVNTILIGKNNFTSFILSNSHITESMGIKGYYNFDENENENFYIGNLDLLFDDLKFKKIDNIVLCDDSMHHDLYEEIMRIANKKMIRTYLIPDFKHFSYNVDSLDLRYGIPIIKSMPEPLENYENQIIKRTFDIVFSSLVIIFLLSWLIPLLGILIKLDSKGPVFFAQKRSGLKNEHFYCLKFRSMKVNKLANQKMATKNDDRITKLGLFLRKTSIDELPQFLNVFIGNMSIVGPRPHMISQTKKYSKILDQYMVRHLIKPGITGWAQVMGARGEIYKDEDMNKRIKKDIWYIQNWSLFLDFKIIFLTVFNVIKGDKQAY